MSDGGTEAGAPDDPWGRCTPPTWRQSGMDESGSSGSLLTSLPDGRVLIGPGEGIYDPKTDTTQWIRKGFGPIYATATVLADQRSVLIAGGGDSTTSSRYACVLHLDRVAAGCVTVAPMLVDRAMHAAALLPDGRVVVVGGLDSASSSPDPPAEIYDPVIDRWEIFVTPKRIGPTDGPYPQEGGVFLLPDRRVFFLGWDSVAMWSPGSDSWHEAPTIPGWDPDFRAVNLGRAAPIGSDVYVSGVFSHTTNQFNASTVYHAATDEWSPLAFFPDSMIPWVVHDLGCGRVLAFGGTATGAMEMTYDPAANRWYQVPTPVQHVNRDVYSVELPDGRLLIARATMKSDEIDHFLILTPNPL